MTGLVNERSTEELLCLENAEEILISEFLSRFQVTPFNRG